MKFKKLFAISIIGIFLLFGTVDLACAEFSCTYEEQPNDTAGTQADESSTPEDGGHDWKYDDFSATGEDDAGLTTCSIVSKLRVYENWPASSDDDNGGGGAEGNNKLTWEWDGPAGSAPGCTYNVDFDGDGDVTSLGTAVATGGGSSSSSGSGDSVGDSSATGCTNDPKAEVTTVGGSCSHNAEGTISGAKLFQPTPEASASLNAGTKPVGSFGRTGTWSAMLSTSGGVSEGGTTFYINVKAKCKTVTTAAASVGLAGNGTGYCAIEVDADNEATVYNVVNR